MNLTFRTTILDSNSKEFRKITNTSSALPGCVETSTFLTAHSHSLRISHFAPHLPWSLDSSDSWSLNNGQERDETGVQGMDQLWLIDVEEILDSLKEGSHDVLGRSHDVLGRSHDA